MLQTTTQIELDLMQVIRALPTERAAQVLDFARWLQERAELDDLLDDPNFSDENIDALELQRRNAADVAVIESRRNEPRKNLNAYLKKKAQA